MTTDKPVDERIAQAARERNYAAFERAIMDELGRDLATLRARMDAAAKRSPLMSFEGFTARLREPQTALDRAAARWNKRA
jgi:hypothetical protein